MNRQVEILERRSDPLPPWTDRKLVPHPHQTLAVVAVKTWLAEMGTEQAQPGLLLYGPTGTGKTLCAARATVFLRGRGIPVLFRKAKVLLDDLRGFDRPKTAEAWGPDSVDQSRERLHSAPVLVIDDLGAHRVTPYVREEICDLIDHRHDFQMPTLITSNLTGTQLAEQFDQRIASRIAGHCKAVKLDGPDARLEKPNAA